MTLPSEESPAPQIREVVGVFSNEQDFDHAIDELQSNGINRARLTALSGGTGVEKNLQTRGFECVQELLDAPDLPQRAVIEPENVGTAQGALVGGLLYVGIGAAALATGGAALAPLIAAMAGGGAVGASVGGFLAYRLGSERAREIEQHLLHGGLALWVRVTPQDEERVAKILKRNGGKEVHAHGVPDVPTSTKSA
jgi:hypothetical protein